MQIVSVNIGFPPKSVPLDNKAVLITDLGIRNGMFQYILVHSSTL